MAVEPLPGTPAALVDCGERVLCLADYHAGLEVALRYDGVEVRSRAGARRERVLDLLESVDADRLVILGDLATAIGAPAAEEREELDDLFAAVTDRVPMTVTKGNHDGDIETVVEDLGFGPTVDVAEGPGTTIGAAGFAHGHTWPASSVLAADSVCIAHEHPAVRLEDEVGGERIERCWLRGRLNPEAYRDRYEGVEVTGELVVFPAFNELVGGTWVNEDDEFLSPMLPDGLADGEAYLLDGTRLGDYRAL